ncbi:unnamed protein product [Orchesella dallaii]|uniref:Uncharacterized protein n=1 Tax=Orchesella dallaii TaxID=48710 RepID=A0ABP1RI93_9HEXA
MAPNLCPWMKLQTGVRAITMTDIVGSIIFLIMITSSVVDLAFNNNDVEQLGIPNDKRILFGAILALLILGFLFGTQIMASIHLYKAASKNDNLTRGFWPWLAVTSVIILLFFFLFIEGLRLMMLGPALLFLLITIYKIYAVLVLISFKRSMKARERAVAVVFNSPRGGQRKSGSVGRAQVV